MIRNHVIATITVRYRDQYKASEDGPWQTEKGFTDQTLIGIFPSKAHARVWAEEYAQNRKDRTIEAIDCAAPHACIIEHTW